jgi:hypothetical protein
MAPPRKENKTFAQLGRKIIGQTTIKQKTNLHIDQHNVRNSQSKQSTLLLKGCVILKY